VPCFSIDDQAADQSVKNAGSRRLVSLHPVLIEAGIVELAAKRGDGQLFEDLVWTEIQGWSKAASKRLNQHIRSLIPDTSKVFHSFRHSFKDLCRDAGIAEDIHDRLTGHTSASVGRGYGAGHSIRRLAEEITKIEGRWRLP
jgi:integrase